MSERAGAAARQRRLRPLLRHERMTVAMALAEQLHHSVNRVERDEALWRQTTRASEVEEVHELYDCLQAQKRPPLRARPGILAEPGPQQSDRTVRRSAGPPDPRPALSGGNGWGVGGPSTVGALSSSNSNCPMDVVEEKEEKVKEERRLETPLCSLVGLSCPLSCMTGAVVQTILNSVEIPQLQFGEQMADVPVMLVRSCGSSTRSSLSDGGFCRILRHFSRSVRMDVSAHFSALDDEEFFVIKGSGWRGLRESDSQVFCHLN